MRYEDLSPEQLEKARACKTPEELLALAKEEGYDLTEEQLQGISGGWSCSCDGYTDPCQTKGCVTIYWC